MWVASVLLETSHPFWPSLRLDAAGFGPGAGRVVPAVPFQSPQFLQADLSHRVVEKDSVYVPVVPVDAEAAHGVPTSTRERPRIVLALWRLVIVLGPGAPPPTVQEYRYVCGRFDVLGCPEILRRVFCAGSGNPDDPATAAVSYRKPVVHLVAAVIKPFNPCMFRHQRSEFTPRPECSSYDLIADGRCIASRIRWLSGHWTAANVLGARSVLSQPVHPELWRSQIAEALIVELAVSRAGVGFENNAPLAQV